MRGNRQTFLFLSHSAVTPPVHAPKLLAPAGSLASVNVIGFLCNVVTF